MLFGSKALCLYREPVAKLQNQSLLKRCIRPGVRMSLQFRDKRAQFWNFVFSYLEISLGSFEYWKVIFRIFLQNNKPFLVFQNSGSVSLRNPIINWEHSRYLFIAMKKITILLRVLRFFGWDYHLVVKLNFKHMLFSSIMSKITKNDEKMSMF